MSQYPDARFLSSANAVEQFPPDAGAEVAFAGRSNAGKSSAINAIVNRRQFARTSKTPGRTQLVNFFALRGDERLVDLPGYGYARVAESVREHWGRLLTRYFEERVSLRGLFIIVDVRRGLSDYDRQMLAFAASVSRPAEILLAKADKLKRGQASRALLQARREVGSGAGVLLFSSVTRQGVDEAREALDRMLAQKVRQKKPGPRIRRARDQ